jgi:hypothetical protein
MLSDVLFDAIGNIKQYQKEGAHKEFYNSKPVKGATNQVVRSMQALQQAFDIDWGADGQVVYRNKIMQAIADIDISKVLECKLEVNKSLGICLK